MTAHERAARAYYATVCGRPAALWDIVRAPKPGAIYDFADARSQTYGQCWQGADGAWVQAPRGSSPVILRLRNK